MLSLENIYLSFEHYGACIEVLKGIDLEVNSKDSLAIMGASGVGKSTLLNVMGSLAPPVEGSVRFNGRNIYEMDEMTLTRFRNREIGFVFQFHHLLPELTAMENAMMPALIARVTREKAADMAREILKQVGLEKRLGHQAGELSGGEQQRVAIARALIMRPKLILADEPTGNLDWSTGQEIVDLLLEFNARADVSMVIATHNHRLATKMSRQMEMIGGQIQ